MNRSIWGGSMVVFIVVLLSVVLLKSQYAAQAGQPPSTTPQATASTELAAPGALQTSSQGTKAQVLPARGEPLDDPAVSANQATESPSATPPAAGISATANFYHIPGSALTPVDSATTLAYDSMGCVHATAGAGYLLNAPLEIPNGSRIVLLRLYYDDTSASDDVNGWITRYNEAGTSFEDLVSVTSTGSAGHGSNYGDLDHIVDTYGWSYVLNARLNVASSALQVCGLRVMYYPPAATTSAEANFFPIRIPPAQP
jgi:hypothetical protein